MQMPINPLAATGPPARRSVVFGFLGTVKDAGTDDSRWQTWRPTVSLFAHNNPAYDRLELFVSRPSFRGLAEQVSADIAQLRPSAQVSVHVLETLDPWNFVQVYAALHGFAKNYVFDEGADYFVHLTTGTHVAQICLFLLLQARYFPARIVETFAVEGSGDAVWQGRQEVIDLNVAAYDQLAQRFKLERLQGQGLLKGGIETRNAAFNHLIGRIEKVALASTAPILLTGPTGAGKSQLASRIYELRRQRHRVSGPFVEVNCATLRGDNAMSALFGHKKGAFTGAVADRGGLLKEADKGILFLDEVAELGLDEQAMLLRAIEDKRFRPLGSEKEVLSDFQLLCGTHQNLAQRVGQGLFRPDLLARIDLWTFALPGLKDRPEDIEPNVLFETERVSQQLGSRVRWSPDAYRRFLDFSMGAPWPGNFRQLGSAVTRMATLSDGYRIAIGDVDFELANIGQVETPAARLDDDGLGLVRKLLSSQAIADADLFDLKSLATVLEAVKQTRSMAEAGRLLFAASRLQKASPNDSDRVRKHLAGWGLLYQQCRYGVRE